MAAQKTPSGTKALQNATADKEKTMLQEIIRGSLHAAYGPNYIVLDITNKCNLNCIGCWTYSPLLKTRQPDKDWFKKELSFTEIESLVADLKKLKTEEIRITGGGEPFMHPDIMRIIHLIKENSFRLDITTNFSLITKEKIDQLVRDDIDNITISLWASSAETYTKTHPNQEEKKFSRIRENLLYLSSARKHTKIVIANVISNINYLEIEAMADFAHDSGADEIYFTLVDPIEGETESLLLSREQQQQLVNDFEKLMSRYNTGQFGKMRIDNPENFLRRIKSTGTSAGNYDSNIIGDIPCTAGWTFARIMANGDVAPCCRAVMLASGNIKNERFSEIWNCPKQKLFRKIGLNLNQFRGFTDKVGCRKTCDNLMHNIETNHKLQKAKAESL